MGQAHKQSVHVVEASEQISVLMDGELAPNEVDAVLGLAKSDAGLPTKGQGAMRKGKGAGGKAQGASKEDAARGRQRIQLCVRDSQLRN